VISIICSRFRFFGRWFGWFGAVISVICFGFGLFGRGLDFLAADLFYLTPLISIACAHFRITWVGHFGNSQLNLKWNRSAAN
jgi:hypothetical protein